MAKPQKRRVVVAEEPKEDEKDHLSVGKNRPLIVSLTDHGLRSFIDFWSSFHGLSPFRK